MKTLTKINSVKKAIANNNASILVIGCVSHKNKDFFAYSNVTIQEFVKNYDEANPIIEIADIEEGALAPEDCELIVTITEDGKDKEIDLEIHEVNEFVKEIWEHFFVVNILLNDDPVTADGIIETTGAEVFELDQICLSYVLTFGYGTLTVKDLPDGPVDFFLNDNHMFCVESVKNMNSFCKEFKYLAPKLKAKEEILNQEYQADLDKQYKDLTLTFKPSTKNIVWAQDKIKTLCDILNKFLPESAELVQYGTFAGDALATEYIVSELEKNYAATKRIMLGKTSPSEENMFSDLIEFM